MNSPSPESPGQRSALADNSLIRSFEQSGWNQELVLHHQHKLASILHSPTNHRKQPSSIGVEPQMSSPPPASPGQRSAVADSFCSRGVTTYISLLQPGWKSRMNSPPPTSPGQRCALTSKSLIKAYCNRVISQRNYPPPASLVLHRAITGDLLENPRKGFYTCGKFTNQKRSSIKCVVVSQNKPPNKC
jgi:hypothetical protein